MRTAFFQRVIDASGLSDVIAAAAVTRACSRAGLDPGRLDGGNLRRALPFLETTLRLYLRDTADDHIEALQRLSAPYAGARLQPVPHAEEEP